MSKKRNHCHMCQEVAAGVRSTCPLHGGVGALSTPTASTPSPIPPASTPPASDNDPIHALGTKLAAFFGLDTVPMAWRVPIAGIRSLGLSEETVLAAAKFGLTDLDFWADRITGIEKLYDFLKSGSLLNAYTTSLRRAKQVMCPHGCCAVTCGDKCWHCHARPGCPRCTVNGQTTGMVTVRIPGTHYDIGTACECTGMAKSIDELARVFLPRKNDTNFEDEVL